MATALNELNSKVWYRLIKVLFILFFVLVFLFFNGILIFDEGISKIDRDRTMLTCLASNEGGVDSISLSDAGIRVSERYFDGDEFMYGQYFEGYNDGAIRDILEVCTGKDASQITIPGVQIAFEEMMYYREMSNDELLDIDGDEGAEPSFTSPEYPKYDKRIFDIEPKYSYQEFIKFFFLGNAAIMLAFEFLRRLFYYIAVGRLYPR